MNDITEDLTTGESEERERVNTDMKEDQAQNAGLSLDANPRDPNSQTRPPRVPLEYGNNVSFSDVQFDRKNYRYYAFYDDPERPGRIENAKAAYWEEVRNVNGQLASRPAGAGRHILMRLPMQYALEDLELKRKKVQATMADYGEIKTGQAGKLDEYAPDDRDWETN